MGLAKNKTETVYGVGIKQLFKNINSTLKEDKLVISAFKNVIVKKRKDRQVFRVTMIVHTKSKSP